MALPRLASTPVRSCTALWSRALSPPKALRAARRK